MTTLARGSLDLTSRTDQLILGVSLLLAAALSQYVLRLNRTNGKHPMPPTSVRTTRLVALGIAFAGLVLIAVGLGNS